MHLPLLRRVKRAGLVTSQAGVPLLLPNCKVHRKTGQGAIQVPANGVVEAHQREVEEAGEELVEVVLEEVEEAVEGDNS